MNKFITKLAKLFLGISMAAGVGVAIGAGKKDAIQGNASATSATTVLTVSSSSPSMSNSGSTHLTVTLSNDGGSNAPKYNGSDVQLYASNYITFSKNTSYNGTISISQIIVSGKSSKASRTQTTYYKADGSLIKTSNGATSVTYTTTSYENKTYTFSNVSEANIYQSGTNQLLAKSWTVSYTYEDASGVTNYTVSFNNNTGSGTMTDATTSGSSYVTPACTFTKSGYEFSKWALNSASGTQYDVGDTITDIGANITLYAVWIEDPAASWTMDTFTVTDLGGGGSYASFSVSGSSGATYVGYCMKNGTNIQFNNYSSPKNRSIATSVSGGYIRRVTVTWGDASGKEFSVYVGNSAYSNSSAGNSGTAQAKTLSASNTTVDISGNYTHVSLYPNGAIYPASVSFYWEEPTKYDVTFNLNEHGSAIAAQEIVEGGTVTKPTDPSATGYSFGGWYKEQACTNAWDFTNDKVNDDTVLYAKWTANQYAISYRDQGNVAFSGTHESGYPTQHTYGSTTTLKTANKTGYTFGGWFTTSTCTGSAVTTLGATSYTAGITLYAKWTINQYTVQFNLNGHGSSAPADQTIDYNETASQPAAPTDTEYDFLGWYKEAGCVNVWNFSQDKVTGDATLYASWAKKTFNISLVSGSHGSLSGTLSVEYGTPLSVTLVADGGYGLPESLNGVTMGGVDISSQVTYSAGAISGPAITGNIVIDAECELIATVYSITTTVSDGGTSGGDTTITDMGGLATVTVTAGSDYKLPDSISVSGASYTYAKSGKYNATISLSGATGNVTISVICVALTSYNINFDDVENASHSGATTITEDGTATIVITQNSGYYSPETEDVTVSGATKVSWTKETNTLVISNPTGVVSISYTPDINTVTGITLSEDEGDYELGDALDLPTITAHYSHIADEELDEEDVSVSGYDPFTVGDHTVTISYTFEGKTVEAEYTAHVAAASLSYAYSKVTSIDEITEGDYLIAYGSKVFDGTDAIGDYSTETITDSKIAYSAALAKQAVHITPLTGDNQGKYSITVSSTNDANANMYIWSSGSASNGLKFTDVQKALTISATSGRTETTGGAWDITDEGNNVMSFNTNNNQDRFRFFKSGTWDQAGYYAVDLYKYVSTGGSEDLIRITAEYTGGDKYVGNTVSVSDFLIKKQYNTGDTLTTLTAEEMATVTIVSGVTLTDTSNTVVLRYVEGGIPQTASVSVSAIEVTAELQSVTLVQDSESVKKDYIYTSGLQWDLTGLSVEIDYDDDNFNLSYDLATLVQNGEATISPAAPSIGDTSFTVSYRYNDEMDISSATVSGITVIEDYVKNISWTGTSGHFKAYAGQKLTAAQVNSWSVSATMASNAVVPLSFSDYTIKVGDKVIDSLDYTWVAADDNKRVTITYGKDVQGNDFVRDPGNITSICPLINAIDYTKTITPAYDEDAEGYYLVSSVSDLAVGDSVIIVASDYDYAMSTTQNANNRGAASITKGDNIIESIGDDVQVFTVEAGNVDNTFAFNTGDGYIYAANSSSNHLKTETTKSGNSSFAITISNGVANMVAQGNYTHNIIKYNNGSTLFSCYTGGQQTVSIYKYVNDTIHHDAVTEITEYANKEAHFDAQYAVVSFARFMNTTMNGADVCSGSFENLGSAWSSVASKYAELITNNSKLSAEEKEWANNMLKYATAQWGSDEDAACVEKAMRTYEFCIANHSEVCNEFLSGVRSVHSAKVSPLVNIIGNNTNTVTIIVIISMVSITAIGGYFFLRKRKEN